MRNSTLMGLIDMLKRGEQLSDEAIDEIDRTFLLLRGEGWSGFIPADQALAAIIRASRKQVARR